MLGECVEISLGLRGAAGTRGQEGDGEPWRDLDRGWCDPICLLERPSSLTPRKERSIERASREAPEDAFVVHIQVKLAFTEQEVVGHPAVWTLPRAPLACWVSFVLRQPLR